MVANPIHITICICTYKRPEYLKRLLGKTACLETGLLFSYSIVIVDNDPDNSAKATVLNLKPGSPIPLVLVHEPRRNISHARNKAVENASGNFVAFIDDDEFPEKTWLINLFSTLKSNSFDGVFGPVLPFYEQKMPKWLERSKLLERPRYKTGTVLGYSEMRTGNVLLSKSLFEGRDEPFDPRFGRTGGEDSYFFKEVCQQGFSFGWCDEAPVFESVPPQRYQINYFLKRALLRGVSEAKTGNVTFFNGLKSIAAIGIYTAILPVLWVFCFHLFIKILVKNCDHIGKMLAVIGINVINERSF